MIVTEKIMNGIKKHNTVYILDFANIVYILMTHFHNNKNMVLDAFDSFLLRLYSKNSVVFIVSKITMGISLVEIFNNEKQKYVWFHNFLKSKRLYIYELQYPYKGTSSIDDLLFSLIMVDIYSKFPLKKIYTVTNDKQKMNKNLFGKSENDNYDLLRIYSIVENKDKQKYEYVENVSSQKIKRLLKQLVITVTKDTYNLDKCMSAMIPLYSKDPNNISYNKISNKYSLNRRAKSNCKVRHFTKKNKLNYVYYLYAYIKYVQYVLHSGNLYGSMSVSDIIRLICR
jgi:hypothetical protein